MELWFQGLNPKSIKQMPDISIIGTDFFFKKISIPIKPLAQMKSPPPKKKLLKELHHEIAQILTKIFRSSLHSGIVPDATYEDEYVSDDSVTRVKTIHQSSRRKRKGKHFKWFCGQFV